jgi:ribonucleoside-diphosphate reductase alpha chain
MQKISKDGKPTIFVENPKNVKDFLPQTELLGMRLEGQARIMIYSDGEYRIEVTNKTKGMNLGDICFVCGQGEVIDAGGCHTCSVCNAQLKCGL